MGCTLSVKLNAYFHGGPQAEEEVWQQKRNKMLKEESFSSNQAILQPCAHYCHDFSRLSVLCLTPFQEHAPCPAHRESYLLQLSKFN
eukprot:1153932-Pelagomonas_calceolata.AAC.1